MPTKPHRTRRLAAHETDAAAAILADLGTVAIPTETVYGLGADAASDEAVAKIFEAKGRPAGHPLIVHLASVEQIPEWADLSDSRARALAETFWPGPLTLILPRTDRVSSLVVGGRDSIGIRLPSHPVARAVLEAFGGGVAAPSANRFGHVSPTTADHVLADLEGRIDAVIDGGPSAVGIESTIVELVGTEPVLLRPGGIGPADLSEVLGSAVIDGRAGDSRAAGMMTSHYAPRARVEVMDRDEVARRAATGALGDHVGLVGPWDLPHTHVWWLPEQADLFAEGVYRALRAADSVGVAEVWVIPPTVGPLLDAVLDRLEKAAAGR